MWLTNRSNESLFQFINITIYSFVFTSPGLILKMYNPHRPGLKDWYSAIEYNRTQLVALAVWNSIMLVINTFLLFGIIFVGIILQFS